MKDGVSRVHAAFQGGLLDRVFYTPGLMMHQIPEPVLTGLAKALALMLKLLSEKCAGSALTFGVFA